MSERKAVRGERRARETPVCTLGLINAVIFTRSIRYIHACNNYY